MTTPFHSRSAARTPTDRWASVGPYYAMFPVEFAYEVVRRYTDVGDPVLDPFAGRASSIYAAATTGRPAVGIEINPVGWVYGAVKLRPAPEGRVLTRLEEIGTAAAAVSPAELRTLPPFFRACYSLEVRRFLLAARRHLRWRDRRIDRTLMALLLVHLHGKPGRALSNQMREGKAMAPDYAVNWWAEREMTPPELDPVQFLAKRIAWRFASGVPEVSVAAEVRRGDSVTRLGPLADEVRRKRRAPFRLLFTSPPYLAVTNYHYDQWLRLWLLGGPARPQSPGGRWTGRFENRAAYADLLHKVFAGCAAAMHRDAVVYVRTDARYMTREATIAALRAAFPGRRLRQVEQPFTKTTQTALFGDTETKPGEVDLIMS